MPPMDAIRFSPNLHGLMAGDEAFASEAALDGRRAAGTGLARAGDFAVGSGGRSGLARAPGFGFTDGVDAEPLREPGALVDEALRDPLGDLGAPGGGCGALRTG